MLLLVPLSMGGLFLSASPAQALRAVRVEKGPNFDGRLDDKVWELAVAFTDFKMAEPKPDSAPTEKTELRIIYDQDNLYLGIHCFDSEPAKISGQAMAHDAFEDEHVSDDLVRILLDPFLDKRNAYIFFINARGSRSEGRLSISYKLYSLLQPADRAFRGKPDSSLVRDQAVRQNGQHQPRLPGRSNQEIFGARTGRQ